MKIDDTVLHQITTIQRFVDELARVETCEIDVLKFLVEKVNLFTVPLMILYSPNRKSLNKL